MMGHYVLLCRGCNKVLSTCRCTSANKQIHYDETPCTHEPDYIVKEDLIKKEDPMSNGPIRFINEARLELPSAQFSLKVLREFVDSCEANNFDPAAKVSVEVDKGNQRDPGYLRISVTNR